MKTSWSETAEAERYIFNEMNKEELRAYKTKLTDSPLLRLQLFYQEKVCALVLLFHRKKLKEETELVHQRLFNDPTKVDFQKNIYQLFKN
jgi:hypothetical protein